MENKMNKKELLEKFEGYEECEEYHSSNIEIFDDDIGDWIYLRKVVKFPIKIKTDYGYSEINSEGFIYSFLTNGSSSGAIILPN